MSEKELKKFKLIEISGERILGKAENIAEYLRYCLNETIIQYLVDGYSWEETAPVVGDIWEYITLVDISRGELFVIEECAMCASGILVKKFEEKEAKKIRNYTWKYDENGNVAVVATSGSRYGFTLEKQKDWKPTDEEVCLAIEAELRNRGFELEVV